jgi:hypothetical protein
MGKESWEERKSGNGVGRKLHATSTNWLYEDMFYAELSRLWTTAAGLTVPGETRENGAVNVTIQRPGQECSLLCSGFANTGNKGCLLLERLLHAGLLQPDLCIESFFIRRSSMWFHFDVHASSFNSGDSLLLVLGRLQDKRQTKGKQRRGARKKGERRKSIKKSAWL